MAEVEVEIKQGDPVKIERLLLRPSEAADAIGVSRARMYQLLGSGEVPFVEIGTARTKRVPVVALRKWIDEKLTEAR